MAMSGAMMAQAGQQAGQQIGGSIPGFLQYFFGHSGAPYEAANKAYTPFYNQAKEQQNPFYQAGTGAIPQFQDWLGQMKDPSGFINNLMGKYQESPFAKFQQQQGMRAAQNMGSATGLTGSTPLQMQAQQNAQNISSQDMNQWLQNVLGVNNNYGSGLFNEMQGGQHSADMLSQLMQGAGEYRGGTAYGQAAGEQNDKSALWGALGKLFGG